LDFSYRAGGATSSTASFGAYVAPIALRVGIGAGASVFRERRAWSATTLGQQSSARWVGSSGRARTLPSQSVGGWRMHGSGRRNSGGLNSLPDCYTWTRCRFDGPRFWTLLSNLFTRWHGRAERGFTVQGVGTPIRSPIDTLLAFFHSQNHILTRYGYPLARCARKRSDGTRQCRWSPKPVNADPPTPEVHQRHGLMRVQLRDSTVHTFPAFDFCLHCRCPGSNLPLRIRIAREMTVSGRGKQGAALLRSDTRGRPTSLLASTFCGKRLGRPHVGEVSLRLAFQRSGKDACYVVSLGGS